MELNLNLNITSDSEPRAIADAIVKTLDSKLAEDIKLLRVEEQTILADYFIICCGSSTTQVRALANEIEYQTGRCGVNPRNMEGVDTANWIVVDYGCVIVHIFDRQSREFYNLDNLWRDSENIDLSPLLK
ncbi:MAG: ribosome silencing factor [Ruminococcaceae bacterium]|nr:ribosome silencing factor [Oscillospiraceae bacterium]